MRRCGGCRPAKPWEANMPLGEIAGHDPDGKWSILCGLVSWLLVGGLGYLAWRALAAD